MRTARRDASSSPLGAPGSPPEGVAPLPTPAADRWQSLGEEIANSISHGLAFLAALAVSPWLVMHAARDGDTANVVGAAVFAASMVLLYFTSMLYHALPASRLLGPSRSKRLFQVLDHSAIYLLIAGTYTPFTLGVLRGPWGWSLFGLVWAMALGGVALKAFAGIRWPRLSTALYVGMGWIAVASSRRGCRRRRASCFDARTGVGAASRRSHEYVPTIRLVRRASPPTGTGSSWWR